MSFITVVWPTGGAKQKLSKSVAVYDILLLSLQLKPTKSSGGENVDSAQSKERNGGVV